MTGYIFKFNGHGCFDPNGIVGEMTDEQIKQHNYSLGLKEAEAMRANGFGTMYLFRDKEGRYSIGTWASEPYQRQPVLRVRHSRNNWGHQRTDVWFKADGSTWHGVNIGDNDIVRCRRNKAS